jgi:hypothetical protein
LIKALKNLVRHAHAFIFALLSRLTHGVTVALQILVLSVKVRILMGQQKAGDFSGFFVPFRTTKKDLHTPEAHIFYFHIILHPVFRTFPAKA